MLVCQRLGLDHFFGTPNSDVFTIRACLVSLVVNQSIYDWGLIYCN